MAFTSNTGATRSSLAEINVTPLVDVVLVLLIIFMITAPVLQSGIEVNVPKTRTVKEITEQRLVLTIDQSQHVFLGDQPINIHDLPQKLARSADPSHQVIYLRADGGALRRFRHADGRRETGRHHQCLNRDPAARNQGHTRQVGDEVEAGHDESAG